MPKLKMECVQRPRHSPHAESRCYEYGGTLWYDAVFRYGADYDAAARSTRRQRGRRIWIEHLVWQTFRLYSRGKGELCGWGVNHFQEFFSVAEQDGWTQTDVQQGGSLSYGPKCPPPCRMEVDVYGKLRAVYLFDAARRGTDDAGDASESSDPAGKDEYSANRGSDATDKEYVCRYGVGHHAASGGDLVRRSADKGQGCGGPNPPFIETDPALSLERYDSAEYEYGLKINHCGGPDLRDMVPVREGADGTIYGKGPPNGTPPDHSIWAEGWDDARWRNAGEPWAPISLSGWRTPGGSLVGAPGRALQGGPAQLHSPTSRTVRLHPLGGRGRVAGDVLFAVRSKPQPGSAES